MKNYQACKDLNLNLDKLWEIDHVRFSLWDQGPALQCLLKVKEDLS